jgi:hypothetical protein
MTILVAKGEDKESKRQLKQGLKNLSFFSVYFVNFPTTMN